MMDPTTFWTQLHDMDLVVSERMKQRFLHYKALIQEVNQVMNLTALASDGDIFAKHFYDSLLIASLIKTGSTVADVGSGAGFPGLVLAIAREDLEITCIEPTTKRTRFLERVVQECQLDNVTIINQRAEDMQQHRERFDVVTARAVAPLAILCELSIPLVTVGGRFIAMKGSKGNEEAQHAAKAIRTLGARIFAIHYHRDETLGERINIEIIKEKTTPAQYPRLYGKIKKSPLE